jgi:hypothetical protein
MMCGIGAGKALQVRYRPTGYPLKVSTVNGHQRRSKARKCPTMNNSSAEAV